MKTQEYDTQIASSIVASFDARPELLIQIRKKRVKAKVKKL